MRQPGRECYEGIELRGAFLVLRECGGSAVTQTACTDSEAVGC